MTIKPLNNTFFYRIYETSVYLQVLSLLAIYEVI